MRHLPEEQNTEQNPRHRPEVRICRSRPDERRDRPGKGADGDAERGDALERRVEEKIDDKRERGEIGGGEIDEQKEKAETGRRGEVAEHKRRRRIATPGGERAAARPLHEQIAARFHELV